MEQVTIKREDYQGIRVVQVERRQLLPFYKSSSPLSFLMLNLSLCLRLRDDPQEFNLLSHILQHSQHVPVGLYKLHLLIDDPLPLLQFLPIPKPTLILQ